uniref:Putative secreted protein n=1 Tax=Ixodes ricinus TaxID=34613 RepID=A0A6B0U8M0_IXORI
MLPCFFFGFLSCLLCRSSRSLQSFLRVVCGSIMSSTKPLMAAGNGLPNFLMYSSSYLATSFWPRNRMETAPLAPMTATSAVGHA